MSELDKVFVYESLSEFIAKNILLRDLVCVVPYTKVTSKSTGKESFFSVLLLNKNSVVCDFGFFLKDSNIVNYVKTKLSNGSFGIFNFEDDYILQNSHIAYSLVYSVELGIKVIDKSCNPIIFTYFHSRTMRDLVLLGKHYKEQFKQSLKGHYKSFNNSNPNLVWISPKTLYYLSRGTTYTVYDDNDEEIVIDINECGIPAEESVSYAYKVKHELGEIPCEANYSEIANCPPEVNFYREISFSLALPLQRYFENNLPILEK